MNLDGFIEIKNSNGLYLINREGRVVRKATMTGKGWKPITELKKSSNGTFYLNWGGGMCAKTQRILMIENFGIDPEPGKRMMNIKNPKKIKGPNKVNINHDIDLEQLKFILIRWKWGMTDFVDILRLIHIYMMIWPEENPNLNRKSLRGIVGRVEGWWIKKACRIT
jgi:hypothetical protein